MKMKERMRVEDTETIFLCCPVCKYCLNPPEQRPNGALRLKRAFRLKRFCAHCHTRWNVYVKAALPNARTRHVVWVESFFEG